MDWFSKKREGVWQAIPGDDEKPLSTIGIWHRAPSPKPSFGDFRRLLQEAVSAGVVERIGCERGPQFYRYTEEKIL